jgi:hypothetical protein
LLFLWYRKKHKYPFLYLERQLHPTLPSLIMSRETFLSFWTTLFLQLGPHLQSRLHS